MCTMQIGSVEETLAYRGYLCMARICNMLDDSYIYVGSDSYFDDPTIFHNSITELTGTDIDRVFISQDLETKPGETKWAFADPDTGVGDGLDARLFYDRDYDIYYLAHPPTRPGNALDNETNSQVMAGLGVPAKFRQAAQLMSLVRPEFRDKIVLTGHSLGGGLAAYAALKAYYASENPWPVRTFAFDPLGLNKDMVPETRGFETRRSPLLNRRELVEDYVDWNSIIGSFVPQLNADCGLCSVGKIWELQPDPVRVEKGLDNHDLENVRYGIKHLWETDPIWRERQLEALRSFAPYSFPTMDSTSRWGAQNDGWRELMRNPWFRDASGRLLNRRDWGWRGLSGFVLVIRAGGAALI